MTEGNPFQGLKNKIKEIEVAGQKIKIKPLVQDAEMFMTLSKEPTKKDAEQVTNIILGMIIRANPEADKDDVFVHIAEHYGEWITKVAEVYGFASAEEFKSMRKKLTGQ